MIIGVVKCEGYIYESHSLKQKRSVVKSVLERARNRLNVTCAEVDHQDVWQRTEFAFVSVSNDKVQVEKTLQKALNLVDQNDQIERATTEYEWL